MRILTNVKALENYRILCEFDNGESCVADIAELMQSPVFQKIRHSEVFSHIENHGTFVSWLNESVDLSADTLWRLGHFTTVQESNFAATS